jgi:hypothetical protein
LYKVIDSIDKFNELSDDSLSVAKFLFHNQFLLNPNSISSTKSLINTWKILMELLLDVDNKSNRLAAKLIVSLYNTTQTKSKLKLIKIFQRNYNNNYDLGILSMKYEPITMLQVSINLFVQLFYEKHPSECINFLIDQFLLTSECESNPMEDEVKQ